MCYCWVEGFEIGDTIADYEKKQNQLQLMSLQ
jgi:hypothetical protein